jgi:phage FluMu protein Com
MSLVAVCKKCGRVIRGRDELAGRPFRCPDCHELNEFPCRSAAATVVEKPPAAEKPAKQKASGICPVCGFDLWIDPDQITDVKGRRMHRACFEEIRPRVKPEPAGTEVVELYQSDKPKDREPKRPAAAKPKPSAPRAMPPQEPRSQEPARPKQPPGRAPAGKPPPSRPTRPKPPAQTPPHDGDLPVAIPIAPTAGPQDLPEAIPEAILEAVPEAIPVDLPEAAAELLPEALPEALPEPTAKRRPGSSTN